ncbi:MAG: U32 family peptidase, partial [Deltaproteobacteria bacterium]|nr:U32 family peptidase [Deltaproteobacteria bacterium]
HCFSLSGQCHFSSWLGGMSGNRGRCAQPCRRRYYYKGKSGYYFSPNDLSALELLPELSRAGVMSFKIEGRMKSAEYVASVVNAYRLVLDAAPNKRGKAIAEAKEKLRASFGRLPTKGFLPDPAPVDIVNPAVHGATGLLLGKVEKTQAGRLMFSLRHPLHLGDRLRVQPATDKPGTGFTVRELYLGNKSVKQAGKHSRVSIGTPPGKSFRKGDAIFKVSSGQVFSLSEAACRKRLAAAEGPQLPLQLTVVFPGSGRLNLIGACAGVKLQREFSVQTYPATERPLTSESLIKVFSKTGNAAFTLAQLDCPELPAMVLPPSQLNQIRREFFNELSEAIAAWRQASTKGLVHRACADLLPADSKTSGSQASFGVVIRHVRDQHLVKNSLIDTLYLPIAAGAHRRVDPRNKNMLVWDLPLVIFDCDWPAYQQEIETLLTQGYQRFRLHNIGQFRLFAGCQDVALEAGYRLFTLNSQAALAWRELGAVAATCNVEDDRDNLADLLQRNTGLLMSVIAYANVPMMISRVPMRNIKPDRLLVSDRNEGYRVESRQSLTVVRAQKDFSLLGHLHELSELGCDRLVIDLSHVGAFSAEGKRILNSALKDQQLPNTSSFNFFQGMA